MSWPQDPTPWADAVHPASSLWALYSPDVPNRELSHQDVRTVDDPGRVHRAGVRWSNPVALRQVRLRFRAGYRPTRLRVGAETPAGVIWLADWGAADADAIDLATTLDATGVVVEQARGSDAWPGVLRLCALSIQVSETTPVFPVDVLRDGAWHRPRMPLATDGSAATCLDVSDALQLQATVPWQRVDGVRLRLRRAGDAGQPAALAAWLARPGPVLWVDDRVVPCERLLDAAEAGAVAGHVTVGLRPTRPAFGRRVAILLPDAPHALALEALTLGPVAGTPIAPALATPAPLPADGDARFVQAGELTLAAAAAVTHPLRHAASLGVPGRDPRVGVLPSGSFAVPTGLHADTLHLALTVDGRRWAPPRTRRWAPDAPILQCFSEHGEVEARVEPGALVLQVTGRADVAFAHATGFALRDGPAPAAMVDAPAAWRAAGHEHRLAVSADRFTLRVPLADAAGGPDLRAATAAFLAPRRVGDGPWRALLDPLLVQASLFVQAGHRVAYGLFPSVYAGDVFGLEEDYLFRGLAYWGLTDAALACARATYLTPEHLAPQHYLHDLRAGLTPWQLEHLLRLGGRAFADLDAGERALIEGLGRRIQAERRKTAAETGQRGPGGWRTFPGLLPPFRFGGDLDFPTQSLYVNAVAFCGLRSAARLAGFDATADLADYRAAILAALDAVRAGDQQPLHSGGDDPVDYYQLMACGILDPMDFFAPGDARAARIDAQVEREGRLFFGLPRFDGWGTGHGIDAVYCHGYLQNALRAGRRGVFQAGLLGLLTAAMDREVHTFREVGPINLLPDPGWHSLPGCRLSQSDPCVGGLGVALMLLRQALVLELPEADGALGRRLRLCAGLLPAWWDAPFAVEGLPSLAGPVDVAWDPARGLRVHAPGAAAVEWVDAAGAVHALAPEQYA
ncbi:MAG: hypothetical protein R3F60_33470 [bacterium]